MLRMFNVRRNRLDRMAAMQRHPAGKRGFVTGNVHVLPSPDWQALRELDRLPERVK